MIGEIEHPDIRHVVYPVHMDGTPTGAKPRLRHYPDCTHFEWRGGLRLGTPILATDEQMRTLIELIDVGDDIFASHPLWRRIQQAQIFLLAHPAGPAIRRIIAGDSAESVITTIEINAALGDVGC